MVPKTDIWWITSSNQLLFRPFNSTKKATFTIYHTELLSRDSFILNTEKVFQILLKNDYRLDFGSEDMSLDFLLSDCSDDIP